MLQTRIYKLTINDNEIKNKLIGKALIKMKPRFNLIQLACKIY